MQATIKTVSPCYGKSYNKGIRISVMCEDKKYASSWIGESAPDWVSEQWWKLIDSSSLGWNDFVSNEVWRLLNLEIDIECEESEYGRNIKKLRGLRDNPVVDSEPEKVKQTAQKEIPDDDIPF
mgnify:CR=1 FL=1